MKTLLLLRHAKSDWATASLSDHARPLAERGRTDAVRMAAYCETSGLVPELILASDAERTRQTAAALARQFETAALRFDSRLYLASPHTLFSVIRTVPDEVKTLMVIGHNPGLHAAALDLAVPGDESPDMARLVVKFPTAALAVFTVTAATWAAIGPHQGKLTAFIRPKTLAGHPNQGG